MTLSRMFPPTLTLLVSLAAAQTPPPDRAPRPPRPARVSVEAPTPPAAPPAPRAWIAEPAEAPEPPSPPAFPTPAAVPQPPEPPLPPLLADQDLPMPMPVPMPRPVIAPLPPMPPDFQDRMIDLQDRMLDLQDKFDFDFNFDFDAQTLKDLGGNLTRDITRQVNKEMTLLGPKIAGDLAALKAPFAMMPQQYINLRGRAMSEDRAYSAGQSALDAHRYGEALEDFNQVTSRNAARADGAWYWKAYTLIKLGKRDEALAAIAELRKSFPNSRWLDDAKALEIEAGKPVKPESESDEDLKLIALNGLVQSDPDRAFPLLETLLKSAQSPSLKKKAVFVLAQSNSPKAQQLLEQVARGQGNPDLQLSAIRYLGERRNQPSKAQLLFDIYNGTSDVNVKRAILGSLESSRDKEHLLQIAKAEKNEDLRLTAIRMLASIQGTAADLWQLYQNEATVEGKQQILQALPNSGNLDRLVEVAKTEREPKLRRYAIQSLSSPRAVTTGDALAAIYANEQDQDVKRAIIDALYSQKNVKPLIVVARSEKDVQMKRRILDRLVNMKSPEATDYLMEILK